MSDDFQVRNSRGLSYSGTSSLHIAVDNQGIPQRLTTEISDTDITIPTRRNSPGYTGMSTRDDDYVYVCVAENKWRRIPRLVGGDDAPLLAKGMVDTFANLGTPLFTKIKMSRSDPEIAVIMITPNVGIYIFRYVKSGYVLEYKWTGSFGGCEVSSDGRRVIGYRSTSNEIFVLKYENGRWSEEGSFPAELALTDAMAVESVNGRYNVFYAPISAPLSVRSVFYLQGRYIESTFVPTIDGGIDAIYRLRIFKRSNTLAIIRSGPNQPMLFVRLNNPEFRDVVSVPSGIAKYVEVVDLGASNRFAAALDDERVVIIVSNIISSVIEETNINNFGWSLAASEDGTRLVVGSPKVPFSTGAGIIKAYKMSFEPKATTEIYSKEVPGNLSQTLAISANGERVLATVHVVNPSVHDTVFAAYLW